MRFLSRHRGAMVSVATLVAIFVAVRYVVLRFRPPGSMTVIEAQAMDMSASGTPLGAAPVSAETVRARTFAPAVTYTGVAVAFTEEEVYPRVTGRLVALEAYPGQRVRAGQALGALDTAELASRADEAEAGRRAAEHVTAMSGSELAQSLAARRAAEAKVAARRESLRDAQEQIQAARAMREQADREAEAAQAALRGAQANVAATQADAEYWSQELAREKQLLDAQAVSREEYQREEAQARSAAAQLAAARAAVGERRASVAAVEARRRQADAAIRSAESRAEEARREIDIAGAELAAASANTRLMGQHIAHNRALAEQAGAQARTARIVRDYTVLRASHDGIVAERLVSPGTLVQPGMAILRIENDRWMRLQANVPEDDLVGIRVGNPVTVGLQQDPGLRLSARVTSVFGAANPSTRTTVVEALAPNPDGRIRAGQYVVMRIATGPARQAITAPLLAIRRDLEQRPYVWTVAVAGRSAKTIYACVMHPEVQSDKPGKCYKCGMDLVPTKKGGKFVAHRVDVSLGSEDGLRVEVTRGLHEGDRVIDRGYEWLHEGDPVVPTEWGPEGPKPVPPSAAPSGGMPGMPGMSPGASAPAAPAAGMAGMPGMPGMGHADPPKGKPSADRPVYTCPMHPDVRSDKPGDCPRCGMKLVRVSGGGAHVRR